MLLVPVSQSWPDRLQGMGSHRHQDPAHARERDTGEGHGERAVESGELAGRQGTSFEAMSEAFGLYVTLASRVDNRLPGFCGTLESDTHTDRQRSEEK